MAILFTNVKLIFLCFLSSIIISSTLYAQDSDNDGLTDTDEINIYFTDPFLPDTDSDLIYDGDEINVFTTNPLDNDSDNDGISDGNEVYISRPTVLLDNGSPNDVIYDGSRFLAVWADTWGDQLMYSQFIDSNGTISSQKFRPNSSTGYTQQSAQLAFDGTNYYLMWTDYEDFFFRS